MAESIRAISTALADRYRIERPLGEGGMARVYLADDLKHQRKVAVKVLRPELAAVLGAERFVHEIRTTAGLHHPHILPLFDSGTVGEAGEFLYYVMPYIEGETLRDTLNRETQLGIAEAVQIATDVADALDYAHRQGVIHRDIKPENILLHDGRPMVADFGIALAVSVAGGGRMTETGLSLGTPHYMSPEQATAEKDLTNRSDIYSLGSVLYEMLTGEPPHTGASAQAVIMKIVTETPRPVAELRKSVPPNVNAAVTMALEKLPADRFASGAAFGEALANPAFTVPATGASAAVGARPGRAARSWRGPLPWVVATVGLMIAMGILGTNRTDRPVLRFTVPLGQGIAEADSLILPWVDSPVLAFSPDGRLLVYNAWDADGTLRLYRQRLDQGRAEPAADSMRAPFFSPDGEWVGVIDASTQPWTLRRMALADGKTETIAELPPGRIWGMTWGDDGTIVVGVGDGVSRLYRIAASGGVWDVVAEPEQPPNGFVRYSLPHMLPGSKAILLQARRGPNPEHADIIALDATRGTGTLVLPNAMHPLYVPPNHLVFMRQGALMATRFDPKRLEVRGEPVTMVQDVMHAVFMPNTGLESGAAQMTVSAAGHLVFARGGVRPERPAHVAWFTPTGDTTVLDMLPRRYGQFRVSPDGTKLAYAAGPGTKFDLFVRDLDRGVDQPLPVGGFVNWPVTWSPDGRWLAVSSDRDQTNTNVYRLAADGSGAPERLARSDNGQQVADWSSQGVVMYLEGGDIWVIPPDSSPRPFFTSDALEMHPVFSPNGRRVAYTSDLSGRVEVYVRPYPGPDPATRISPNGGTNVAWSRDGRRIYYVHEADDSPRAVLMAVEVGPGPNLRPGRAVSVIDPWGPVSNPVRTYDVSADDSFITTVTLERDLDAWTRSAGVHELHVVWNFVEELRARVPN